MYFPRSVLIVKADRLYADILKQIVLSVIPTAACSVVTHTKHALAILKNSTVDFLLTGTDPSEGDVLDLFSQVRRNRSESHKIFVVTNRRDPRIVSELRSLAIKGIFDAVAEGIEQLRAALRRVCQGKVYWSRSLLNVLNPKSRTVRTNLLTPAEQRTFAVIGDGSDDKAAAKELGVRPSTVASVRRQIHRKLGIRQRGELVRMALMSGYVCLTSDSVVRPGFDLLSRKVKSRNFSGRLPD